MSPTNEDPTRRSDPQDERTPPVRPGAAASDAPRREADEIGEAAGRRVPDADERPWGTSADEAGYPDGHGEGGL